MKAGELNPGDCFRIANEMVGSVYMAAEVGANDVKAIDMTLNGWDMFIHASVEVEEIPCRSKSK